MPKKKVSSARMLKKYQRHQRKAAKKPAYSPTTMNKFFFDIPWL